MIYPPSLRYYLLVDADHLNARLLTRVESDRWTEQLLDREDIRGDTRLAPSLDDLYEDTGLLM